MRRLMWAGAVVTCALPAGVLGQMTGVSRPESVPITTSPEGIQQPVYEAPSAPMTLKHRTFAPSIVPSTASSNAAATASAETKPALKVVDPDAMIVGDEFTPLDKPDDDANVVTRVAGPPNRLPVGTLVKVRMAKELTTTGTTIGTEFTAELTEPVQRDGRVLLPAGSTVTGRVTDVHGGRRITGAASVHLQPTAIMLPDGTKYKMYAQVIDTDRYKRVTVDDEGTISRRDHKMSTFSALSLATGSGAAAGAVFGGWPGALIGGAVGAGVGTVVWLKQDRQEELPAGTKIVFSLTSPLAVGVE